MIFEPDSAGITIDRGWIEPHLIPVTVQQKNDLKWTSPLARAILLPHAGFLYSGNVLRKVLGNPIVLNTKWDHVIFLCANHFQQKSMTFPSHVQSLQGFSPDPIFLSHLDSVQGNLHGMMKEHSWQVDLVAVHEMLSQIKHVKHLILLIGQDYRELVPGLLHYIRTVCVSPLFVISSDFTHYGPNYDYTPFQHSNVVLQIMNKDKHLIREILSSPDLPKLEWQQDTVCGIYAIKLWKVIERTLFRDSKPKLVGYDISGAARASEKNHVSYAGITWTQTVESAVARLPRLVCSLLVQSWPKERTLRTLIQWVNQLMQESSLLKEYHRYFDHLNQSKGVFVTLRYHQSLQGCLGIFAPDVPLHWNFCELVVYFTLATLFEDSRFSNEEVLLRHAILTNQLERASRLVKEYTFSVDLLDPSFITHNFWKDYIPCLHGIILEKDHREATFLASVMREEKWISSHPCSRPILNKEKFRVQVFGALLEKMGDNPYLARSPNFFQKVEISLYEGHEYMDYP
jgi:AmmeMemoRadiSam system protein B